MAVFFNDLPNTDKWSTDNRSVFSEAELEIDPRNPITLKTVFKELYNAYKEIVKLWWEYFKVICLIIQCILISATYHWL